VEANQEYRLYLVAWLLASWTSENIYSELRRTAGSDGDGDGDYKMDIQWLPAPGRPSYISPCINNIWHVFAT
jgi:hypothetical protein